jgi:DNA-binding IclR family transcriptional regulator
MNAQALSAHVLSALARAQIEARPMNLETLTEALRVRKTDIRRTVTVLHRQGYVDALHMRLTLAGFAVGRALLGEALPVLRRPALSAVVAA